MEYILVGLTVYLLYYLKNKYWQPTGINYKQNVLGEQINTNQTSYLALIILILFFALRDTNVGGDTPTYVLNFKMVTESGSINGGYNYNILYQLITLICGKVFGYKFGFNVSLLIFATIICLCVSYTLKHTSKNIPLAMFIFTMVSVYIRSFNLLRQGIAIAILSVAFVFVLKHKPVHFVCTVVIATLFHSSAILFLITYPICLISHKYLSYYIIIVYIFTALFSAFHKEIIYLITRVYGRQYYDNYIGLSNDIMPITNRDLAVFIFASVVAMLLLYFVIYICNTQKEKQNYASYFYLYMLYPMIKFIGTIQMDGHASIYMRLTTYFSWIFIIFVPNIISMVTNRKMRILAEVECIVLCIIASIFLMSSNGLIPYTPLWS